MIRWAVLALAVIGGTLLDRAPPRPPIVRAGMRVLEGDFHVHSRFSDGFLSAAEVPFAARRNGLDVIAVTDHNTVFPSQIARWIAEHTGGPIVITGEEITTGTHHLIALGLEETVTADRSLLSAVLEVHKQRGIAIAAHPSQRFWSAFEPVLSMIDGAEVMHPMIRRNEDRGASFEAFFARLAAARAHPAAIGSSDNHAMNGLGSCRTVLFVRDASPRSVLDALRAGRTAVIEDDGRIIGDAEVVAALEAEPIPRAEPPSYRASDLADALVRSLGWVALIAIVFGRRRF